MHHLGNLAGGGCNVHLEIRGQARIRQCRYVSAWRWREGKSPKPEKPKPWNRTVRHWQTKQRNGPDNRRQSSSDKRLLYRVEFVKFPPTTTDRGMQSCASPFLTGAGRGTFVCVTSGLALPATEPEVSGRWRARSQGASGIHHTWISADQTLGPVRRPARLAVL